MKLAKYTLVALSISAAGWFSVAFNKTEPTAEAHPVLPVNQIINGRFVAANQQLLSYIINRLRLVSEEQSKDSDLAEPIEATRAAFTAMNSLRTNIDKDAMRQKILDELLRDANSLPLAQKILADSNFARKTYGKEQAVARVYAIKLLDRNAELGDLHPLKNTISQLAVEFANLPEVPAGRSEDFIDLIDAYIQRNGLDSVKHHLKESLSELGYSPKLAQHFRKAFFWALHGKVEEAELSELLNSLFKQEKQNA